jgi:hypothetical protein
MKNIIIKYLNILLAGLLLFGCSEEFLDLKPIAQDSEETFYSTMDGAEKAITACYSNFCLEKTWDLTIMMTLGSIASDDSEAGAGGKDDVIEFQHVDQMRHTPSEANVFIWPWGYCFRAINHCNIAIEKLPEISKETDPALNASLIRKRLGEAKFLRALNYFVLTQIFGGVPVMDHVPLPTEYTKGRDDIIDVYKLIRSDLRFAMAVLPEKSQWGESNIGRASKGSATALMAKTFLYESSYAKNYPGDERFTGMTEQWDSVLFYAEQVINSGEYGLLGINGERFDTWWSPETGGYRCIFLTRGNNSSEGVFEVQNVQDGQEWFDTRGTALVRWTAPREYLDANGNHVAHGWGWLCPSPQLVASYEEGDPRFKATVMTADDSIPSMKDDSTWFKPSIEELYNRSGLSWYGRKYECNYNEYWKSTKTWMDGPLDLKLIRFADVVLWAAEAAYNLNDNGKALEYINMVRTRARNSGDTGVPDDLTGTVTMDDIVYERYIELAMEGHRFFDLVRWNLAEQYLNHTLADGDQITFESPQYDFFPIPITEIDLSGNNLKQYPGWE